MAKKVISLSAITTDGSTQMRARTDQEFVDELAEAYKADQTDDPPPPVVFWDGEHYWLGDGHHRVLGAIKAGRKGIEVVVEKGTQDDAILYGCSANDTHGLRRTLADKRKAVKTLLEHKTWKSRSDRWISDQCRVSHTMVGEIRKQLSSTGNSASEPAKRQGKDGRAQKAKKEAKDDGKPKAGQELFDFAAYFTHLNALRRAPDHMYRAFDKVRADGAIARDPAYEGLSRALEAFHGAFEDRWKGLADSPFPKQ